MSDVTVILTSCGRQDLLKRTLDSFFKFNKYPIEKFIVGEDSGNKTGLEKDYPQIEWVYSERLGMIGNAMNLYNRVKTEYVFHMEDDWEFYHTGFIEKSKAILEAQPKILLMWLREQNDTNGHPIDWMNLTDAGIEYNLLAENYQGVWNGYTTNPSLKRMKDLFDLNFVKGACETNGEHLISKFYGALGYRAGIFKRGFVKHIGENRTVI